MVRTKMTARFGCTECRKAIHQDRETCMECKLNWHTNCSTTTLRVMGMCEECYRHLDGSEISDSEEDNLHIAEDQEESSSSKSNEADMILEGESYRVKAIVNHIIEEGKRKFVVQWEDNSTTTEPEENLDGCIETLEKYIENYNASATEKLAETTLTPLPSDRVGNSSSAMTAMDNWVTIKEIIECVESIRVDVNWPRFKPNLPIIPYEEFKKDADAIVLLKFERHCFCLLFRLNTEDVIIADGNDIYIREPSMKDRIDRKLSDLQLRSIPTGFSAKVDQCGAAAALIALELGRLYDGKAMDTIAPGKYIKEVISKRLHKHRSLGLPERKMELLKANLICEHCGKTFKNSARKALQNHLRIHK